MVDYPLEILFVGRLFDLPKLGIAGSREHVEWTRLGAGISCVPRRSALECLNRVPGDRAVSHAGFLAHQLDLSEREWSVEG